MISDLGVYSLRCDSSKSSVFDWRNESLIFSFVLFDLFLEFVYVHDDLLFARVL